jgi:hypothetical protein
VPQGPIRNHVIAMIECIECFGNPFLANSVAWNAEGNQRPTNP